MSIWSLKRYRTIKDFNLVSEPSTSTSLAQKYIRYFPTYFYWAAIISKHRYIGGRKASGSHRFACPLTANTSALTVPRTAICIFPNQQKAKIKRRSCWRKKERKKRHLPDCTFIKSCCVCKTHWVDWLASMHSGSSQTEVFTDSKRGADCCMAPSKEGQVWTPRYSITGAINCRWNMWHFLNLSIGDCCKATYFIM